MLSKTLGRTFRMSSSSSALQFIDIGANLTDPVFTGLYRGKQKHESDFDAMLNRAREVGMEKIMLTGGSLEESAHALKIAKTDPMLYSTVGVHPTRCSEFESDEGEGPEAYYNSLKELLRTGMSDKKIVAIGECGLDYDRLEFCPKDIQKKYFEKQFDLAQESRLPMFLHNRNTGGDFVKMIRANRERFTTGVVHSFTGSWEEAQELLDLDLYIGINGCSLKTSENCEVAKKIPFNRLMLETDAPWCDIRSTHAGYSHVKTKWKIKKAEKFEAGCCVKGRNEPCTIIQVLEVLAGLHQVSPSEIAEIVYENTNRVFFDEK